MEHAILTAHNSEIDTLVFNLKRYQKEKERVCSLPFRSYRINKDIDALESDIRKIRRSLNDACRRKAEFKRGITPLGRDDGPIIVPAAYSVPVEKKRVRKFAIDSNGSAKLVWCDNPLYTGEAPVPVHVPMVDNSMDVAGLQEDVAYQSAMCEKAVEELKAVGRDAPGFTARAMVVMGALNRVVDLTNHLRHVETILAEAEGFMPEPEPVLPYITFDIIAEGCPPVAPVRNIYPQLRRELARRGRAEVKRAPHKAKWYPTGPVMNLSRTDYLPPFDQATEGLNFSGLAPRSTQPSPAFLPPGDHTPYYTENPMRRTSKKPRVVYDLTEDDFVPPVAAPGSHNSAGIADHLYQLRPPPAVGAPFGFIGPRRPTPVGEPAKFVPKWKRMNAGRLERAEMPGVNRDNILFHFPKSKNPLTVKTLSEGEKYRRHFARQQAKDINAWKKSKTRK